MNKLAKQKLIFFLLGLATLVIILPVLFIFIFLLKHGLPGITWEFLTAMPRRGMREGGIFPCILGTLLLVAGTILCALPLGVFGAVYLSEYARRGPLLRLIRLAIVNLAGVPSVVYGLFGLGVFVLTLKMGSSILAGSLTLAILILPVIITASEEALLAVPQTFREASLGLGATRWQTIRRVVLPNAMPGIITGAILGISRAAGETAPILFTVAAFFLPRLPKSVFDPVMVLPYHLYIISTQVPDAPPKIQWGTALTLLVLVLGMNVVATLIRTRYRTARKW